MFLMEQIINSNYIQYNRLTDIVNNAFKNSNANTVNIYVDLYSMLKPLYQNDIYKIDNYATVTSCIVNLASHYRAFFRTRYNVESNFYMIFSKNCPYINKQFYIGYNSKHESRFNVNIEKDDMIQKCLELFKILVPYLPNIYYIESTFETSVVMYDIICRNELKNNNPNIIITKDKYTYQLCAIKDNCTIFRPKKNKGIDVSYYINKDNILHTYLVERGVKSDNLNPIVNPELFSLILSLSSISERNIKSLININQVLKIVSSLVENGYILNGYNSDLNYLYNSISKIYKKEINKNIFENRFKAIDIVFQHSVFINTLECKNIESVLIDLYDPEGIKLINNKYFDGIPLDVERL